MATSPVRLAAPGEWTLDGISFDAWLSMSHNTSLTITQHPVEVGASVTDHSFVNPRRFFFVLGVSDSPVGATPPVFTGPLTESRAINAYLSLVDMQRSRRPLALRSKYGNYSNILIEAIDTDDDYTTRNILQASVTMVEIITVGTQTSQRSLFPQVTGSVVRGQQQPQPR